MAVKKVAKKVVVKKKFIPYVERKNEKKSSEAIETMKKMKAALIEYA